MPTDALTIEPIADDLLPPVAPGDPPSRDNVQRLLAFNQAWQERDLATFASFHLQWHRENPGQRFPGLCAEVDSITGQWRPLAEQRAWTWGDGRALGIWCHFLQASAIPDHDQTITLPDGEQTTLNLHDFYNRYCDDIYESLNDRLDAHDGRMPFTVDVATNRVNPRDGHAVTPPDRVTMSDAFAIHGLCQYGLLREDHAILHHALNLLDNAWRAANERRFVSDTSAKRSAGHGHGPYMILSGAAVDLLKSLDAMNRAGRVVDPALTERIIAPTRFAADIFCGYHWSPAHGGFSEFIDPVTRLPFVKTEGQTICAPGHAVEGVGFFAELLAHLPEHDPGPFRFNRGNLLTPLRDIFDFVCAHGFADTGLMLKHRDLRTDAPMVDLEIDGRAVYTSPWWAPREHAAAALRLYTLLGDDAIWQSYLHAIDISYRRFANARIGGLMVQTLDAHTGEPLPLHPATGNLDPMHSPRARQREIEALNQLLAAGPG